MGKTILKLFWSVPGRTNKQGQGNCTTYIDTILMDYNGEKVEENDKRMAIIHVTKDMDDRTL